ncbi:RecT family recombinase [Bacillus sp. UNCCL81]|uniref:RecT family recombinase n=1 Tax=Bacillus sp. UNCCL81 TaxID=1502755 RepID=UPI0008E64ECB|nr:RecT family recombinase [Bacillus sp. UNCCL81]SFD44717.1 recombination protein RecT [Bacillus sp. UNCCL81]
MSNQVAVSNTQAVVGTFTQNELDTLKHTIAVGTSNEQFALFVQTCVNSGLNPFLNQIYCIVYGGKMSIQVAVEGVLALARKQPGFKGVDVELVHENDDFKYNPASKEITHSVGFPRGKVIGGYAIAKKENFTDVVTLMEVSEVEHMTKGNNKNMWTNYFNDMFKKHIMKRAAKLQYGIEIAEDEQIGSSSVDEATSGYRKEITPNQIQIAEGEVIDPEDEMKSRWSEIKSKQVKYSLSEDELKNIIKVNFNKVAKELTLQQLVGLSKLIDLEGKKKKTSEPEEITFDDLDEF